MNQGCRVAGKLYKQTDAKGVRQAHYGRQSQCDVLAGMEPGNMRILK